MHVYEVLRRPIITEKMTMLQDLGKYAFEVAPEANKLQIKEAVETAFDVTVTAVNTMYVKPKRRRVGRHWGMTPRWKKAIVTLAPGQRLNLIEGV
jgi:large subunit ribosomal protein L23